MWLGIGMWRGGRVWMVVEVRVRGWRWVRGIVKRNGWFGLLTLTLALTLTLTLLLWCIMELLDRNTMLWVKICAYESKFVFFEGKFVFLKGIEYYAGSGFFLYCKVKMLVGESTNAETPSCTQRPTSFNGAIPSSAHMRRTCAYMGFMTLL